MKDNQQKLIHGSLLCELEESHAGAIIGTGFKELA